MSDITFSPWGEPAGTSGAGTTGNGFEFFQRASNLSYCGLQIACKWLSKMEIINVKIASYVSLVIDFNHLTDKHTQIDLLRLVKKEKIQTLF